LIDGPAAKPQLTSIPAFGTKTHIGIDRAHGREGESAHKIEICHPMQVLPDNLAEI
jgi:hypothetical protein